MDFDKYERVESRWQVKSWRIGSGALNSPDQTVSVGTPLTVCLKDSSDPVVSDGCVVNVLLKTDTGDYFQVDALTAIKPAIMIVAAGVYRFSRPAGSHALKASPLPSSVQSMPSGEWTCIWATSSENLQKLSTEGKLIMAGITLAHAQAQLTMWLEASAAVASSQMFEIETGNGRRKLQRADAAEIRQQVQYWDQKVKDLTPSASGGRRRVRYVVPC